MHVHVQFVFPWHFLFPQTNTGIFFFTQIPLLTTCIVFFKDEAFDLWQQRWGKLYLEGSPSKLVIDDICKNYYLVNLVDNDFVKGNCLWETLEKTVHLRERTSQSEPAEVIQ